MSSLLETLRTVRLRIAKLRDRKELTGEQDTKGVLIEPVLSALGWNTQEPDDVRREYRAKSRDNPIDYALLLLRTPCLFVEAKPLGENIDVRRWKLQTLTYASATGVEWCVLTNGDDYHLYNTHAAVGLDEKLFRKVRISDLSQEEQTLDTLDLLSKAKMAEKRINILWTVHFVYRKVKIAVEDLFRSVDGGLVRLIRRRSEGLTPTDIRKAIKTADFQFTPPVTLSGPERPPKPRRKPSGKHKGRARHKVFSVTVANLIEAGIITPPLDIQRKYKGALLKGTIGKDGKVVWDGTPYDSTSTAAGMARKSVIGSPAGRRYPQTNGWGFWQYQDPDTGRLLVLDVLRQRYLKRTVTSRTAEGGRDRPVRTPGG